MKNEGFQQIYRMHEPSIKTEFGDRCMEAIGTIKGLEVDDTVNYILIPAKSKDEKATSWHIHRLPKEGDVKLEHDFDVKKLNGVGE